MNRVAEVLTAARPSGPLRPQFTTQAYLSNGASGSTQARMELYAAAETERSRLTFLLARLGKEKGLLVDGRIDPYCEEQQARLHKEERGKLEAEEDFEDYVWSPQAVETVGNGLKELYRQVVDLKKRIGEAEAEIKKMRKKRERERRASEKGSSSNGSSSKG